MNPIDQLFQRLRTEGRKAFIPFLSAGDPDLPTTTMLAQEVVNAGADLLEIGFPYSDPIADGPVIQASYTRALQKGLTLDAIFDMVRQLADTPAITTRQVPLVGMVSYSLIHRRGPASFLDQAMRAGMSGIIVPDLPVDESEELTRQCAIRDFKCIHLVTPTTPRPRALRIVQRCTGFLYCVSVAGITGERQRIPEELHDQLAWLRSQTTLPLCVGFGISKPDQVRLLRESVDGVIVGSALVRFLEQWGKRPATEIVAEMTQLVRTLGRALHGEP